MELTVPPRRRSRLLAHRRALAVLAVSVAFLSTASYWLATTGSSSLSIQTLPGASSSGAVADVTPLTSSVTRTNGAANLQVGVALDKITIAQAASNKVRVMVAWTNASQGAQVLNNPNAQISVGIYHPIHTGNCIASSNSVDAPLVNITDTNSATLCASLDQSSTGSASVSSTGKLLLTKSIQGGFLLPALDGNTNLSACTTAVNDSGAWCQPTSVTTNQRALFVIASIVTPGGTPYGQQSQLSTLSFYVEVKRLS